MKLDLSILIGFLVSIGTLIWTVYKYYDEKKREQNRIEFETFHKLIKELVQPDPDLKITFIDRQAAIVFELRHFKRYYPLSYRTLIGLKNLWKDKPELKRLIEEIDLTLAFLEPKIK
jgi:hypothetical protein